LVCRQKHFLFAPYTTLALSADVSRKPTKNPDYGVVVSTRLRGDQANQIARLAKAKSSKFTTVRPSDIFRIAVDEYLSRNSTARAAA